MGLLYPFPVSESEVGFYEKTQLPDGTNQIVVKTYGLPYVFWLYAFCCIVVIFFMFLAIKEPIFKLIQLGDSVDATLGYSLLSFLLLLPVVLLGFFFFEKRIIASKNQLQINYRMFGVPFRSKLFKINANQLGVKNFIQSPNMARIKDEKARAGFENKGYFILTVTTKDKETIIDRHSRKIDLEKLKTLLSAVLE